MDKIENAIKEVHFIDNKSNKLLNKIHPLVKLVLTVIYIIFLTSLNKYDLTKTLAMGIYLWLISIIGDISIKNCLSKLKIVLLLLIILGIANPILDRNVIAYIGIIPITTGMISAITLILKGVFSIIASYFLITTTSIEDICYALKKMHIPSILITVIMLIYRDIVIFLKEVERIWTAYHMRAPKQKGVKFEAWGSMIGSLMIRSVDKAETVYQAMELRGFNQETFFVKKQKIEKTDILWLIIGIILLAVIRFIPIFELIGELFI